MMKLTPEQQAILDGAQGETMAKVMKTQVMYGEAFGAEKMVPVTSDYNHLVTSFGLKMLGPVYELMDKLLEANAPSKQKFSVDPRPLDPNVPANFLQKLVFNKFIRFVNLLRCFFKVDDMNVVASCKNERFHFWVPFL